MDSPEDKNAAGSVVRLPGIREDLTPSTPAKVEEAETTQFIYTGISLVGASCSPANSSMSTLQGSQGSTKLSLQTPSTPRIDISRASSSSHHEDSRDSTPDRELFEGHDPTSAKLGLGFREEGTLDLRSSTEELDFQDSQSKAKSKARPQSPCLDSYHSQQRKDSQSSELGLLSISGRTSRLSSIGSQGSAQSRLSNASHLSVISGQSGLSRSPSPHKMLLETSFCGTKPQESAQQIVEKQGTKNEEDIEKVILSRKHDPTKAILAEGIVVDSKTDKVTKPTKIPPEKPARKIERTQNVKSDITIKVDKPPVSASSSNNKAKLPKTIVSKSGVVYTYIPLKGPLPEDMAGSIEKAAVTKETTSTSGKVQTKSTSSGTKTKTKPTTIHQTESRNKLEEPKYIRIKLKPDHLYDDDSTENAEIQKPDTLNLTDINKKSAQSFPQIIEKNSSTETVVSKGVESQAKSICSTPSASPKPPRHQMLKETVTSSKSPSPSLSRRSSFASLFKSKEGILSPDSPTVPGHKRKNTITGIIRDASDSLRERRRSRSKSRERERTPTTSVGPSSTESIDSKGKQKSVFSIFKSKKPNEKLKDEISSSDGLHSMEGIEFKFKPDVNQQKKKYNENPLEGESIRIPLHSPTYYENRDILQELRTSSQDSQETVIEATAKNTDVIIESQPKEIEVILKQTPKDEFRNRQSSTSSENIVFSTKLGSDNAVFTTKLPKEKHVKKLISENHFEKSHTEFDADFKHFKPETDTLKDVHLKSAAKEESFTRDKRKEEFSSKQKEEIPTSSTPIPLSSKDDLTPTKKQQIVPLKKEENLICTKKDESVISIKKDSSLGTIKKDDSFTSIKKETSSPNIKKDISSSNINKELTPPTPEKPMADIKLIEKLKKEKVTSNVIFGKENVEDDRNSSESEKDSEIEFSKSKIEKIKKTDADDVVEIERAGLVLQQDSFEEELPYVPTTLPLERSVAMPIVPVKQRGNIEMKMYPIERPRSTTPIIPSSLEDYCEEIAGYSQQEQTTKALEKLKISLPKDDGDRYCKAKSPRKIGNTNWFEFAEKGITSQRQTPVSHEADITPPPLPPKGMQKEWINFEEIPERRKPPKRIQTIPSRGNIEVPESVLQDNVVYSYVNPEDCKCECHEINAREREKKVEQEEAACLQEDELPLLDDETVEDDKTNKKIERMKLDVTILDRGSVVR